VDSRRPARPCSRRTCGELAGEEVQSRAGRSTPAGRTSARKLLVDRRSRS
jgi:hypothetical protein